MHVLIVEHRAFLVAQWQAYMHRLGWRISVAQDQVAAVRILSEARVDAMILDLDMTDGSPLTVSDYAGFRQPWINILFVTNQALFSDGSIFQFCANACGFLRSSTRIEDMAALMEHHSRNAKAA